MSTPYSFNIRITVSNEEGHEDVIFEEAVTVADEEDLLGTKVAREWTKAAAMSDERADDGTDWDVDIECLSVIEPMSGRTDWEDDMLPQRDEVTAFLSEQLNAMAPEG